jgi:hypothetical protein
MSSKSYSTPGDDKAGDRRGGEIVGELLQGAVCYPRRAARRQIKRKTIDARRKLHFATAA